MNAGELKKLIERDVWPLAEEAAQRWYEKVSRDLALDLRAEIPDETLLERNEFEKFVRPAMMERFLRRLSEIAKQGADGWNGIYISNLFEQYEEER